MNIILWIILGGLAGWLASAITNSSYGIFGDIILGIIGAIVGGFLMNLLGYSGINGFNIYSFVVAVIGAVVAIYIGRLVRRT